MNTFCRFRQPKLPGQSHFQHPAHLCSPARQAEIGQLLQSLGLGQVLSFTPCLLWQQLQGRTLWVVGDSQVPLSSSMVSSTHVVRLHTSLCTGGT